MLATPCEVLMSVHDNVLNVVISKEVVPDASIEVECVVEHELQARLLLLHHRSNIAIEILEDVKVGGSPGLVHGLNSVESWMITPSVKETLNGVLGPLDVVVVDGDILVVLKVPLAHPFADSLVAKVVHIDPFGPICETRIVKAILRSLDGMNVEEDLDVILLGHVKEPLDFVLGTLSAANEGAIGLQGPIANGNPNDLNLAVSHHLERIFGDPGIPVITKDSVSLIGTKGLAESVLVHPNSLSVGLVEESVEERRGDPRLQHLPSSDVSANHGISGSGRR